MEDTEINPTNRAKFAGECRRKADRNGCYFNSKNTDGNNKQQVHSFIKYLRQDIRTCYNLRNGREKSKVFLLVRGGNAEVIKQLLQHLRENGEEKELRWLLGYGQSYYNRYVRKGLTKSCNINHILTFLLTLILFVVLTPVFYAFHSTAYQIYMSFFWKRPSKHADLPLFYALLSENSDMVALFLQHGLSILEQDTCGNNVYHYLADMSLEQPQQAWRCHEMLTTCVDVTVLRQALTKQKNDMGLTAFECVAKHGSLLFFAQLSNDVACISTQVLQVTKDSLSARMGDNVYSSLPASPSPANTRSVRVLEMDISMYEQHDILGKQSYPLQLISSRSVDTMSQHDVRSLLDCKFLNNWMKNKMHNYAIYSVLGHLLEFLVTLLFLVYLINQGGDMTIFPLVRPFLESYMTAVHQDMYVVNGTNTTAVLPCYNATVTWTNGTVNACTAQALQQLSAICPTLTSTALLQHIFILDNVSFDTIEFIDTLIQYAIAGILLTKITLDFILRICFLYNNYNFRCKSIADAVAPLMYRRLPGSYCERQLTLCMSSLFAVFLYTLHLLNETVLLDDGGYINEWKDFHLLHSNNVSKLREVTTDILQRARRLDIYEPLVSKLVVVCLLFRFLQTIHTLRLFPSIGFFIITTKKMAKHLCQFAVVFVIVSLAFAAIFHFIMRDPDCPAIKDAGFESIADSLFSAYHVAIGGSSYDFTRHLNTRIAFIIYTLISVMLLLNLIIAVMTTTAQELNRSPWRHALCVVERWDEILGTETIMNAVALSATKLRNSCLIVLRKGHCIKSEESKKPRHIIEVVHATT